MSSLRVTADSREIETAERLALTMKTAPCGINANVNGRIHDTTIRSQISEETRKKIIRLSGPKPRRFILEAVLAWVAILTSVCIASFSGNIFITLLAIFIVATRQNVLGLLIHEQT